jgi:hypothetical protein
MVSFPLLGRLGLNLELWSEYLVSPLLDTVSYQLGSFKQGNKGKIKEATFEQREKIYILHTPSQYNILYSIDGKLCLEAN